MGVRLPMGLVRLRSRLPRGGALSDAAWASRHRGITALAWLHVPVLLLVALLQQRVLGHAAEAASIPAALALASRWPGASQKLQSSAVTLSLFSSTAVLIYLSGGLIELHFHFFVVVAVIALYQSWTPFLLGLSFVVAHHAVMGTLMPGMVYNHSAALAHPGLFALMHGSFVLAESVACVMYWRVTEDAQDALLAEREELNRALGVKDNFITLVSHELRTPLTSIIGYLDLVMDEAEEIPGHMAGHLQTVNRNAERLLVLVTDLLAAETAERETMTLARKPTNISSLAQMSLNDFALRAETAAVTITADIEPDIVINADPARILQVIDNLLSNAVKYTPPTGTVTLSLRGESDAVLLDVDDTGIGISPEDQGPLFTKFFRARTATHLAIPGIGLGLMITRMIVQAHGGTISVHSQEGIGTSMHVTLPSEPARVPTEASPVLRT